ncbi:MAG: Holliday junction branch migration DNA helicase RuvB, partial [Anaerolineae bacterium]|nr:Holliday junction branch migration DNA helicase RuvB [Anaerolineae bacterium]
MHERIISPQPQEDEVARDRALRPQRLADLIDQDRVRENLAILIEAAKRRNEALDHVLFYGPPGLGKTTLAHVTANEMDMPIRVTSGPAIERAGDLAAILSNLREKEVLFIDEVHRLGRVVEEILYPAMEDFALDFVIGKGPSARSIRLKLPHFTIVGATTRLALLTAPLRARFGATFRVDFYDQEALEAIVRRGAWVLEVEIDDAGIAE